MDFALWDELFAAATDENGGRLAYLTSRENSGDGSPMVRQLVLLSGLLQLPDTAPANPFKIPELSATYGPALHPMRSSAHSLAPGSGLQIRPSDILPRSACRARASDRLALAVRARDRVRLGFSRRTRLVRVHRAESLKSRASMHRQTTLRVCSQVGSSWRREVCRQRAREPGACDGCRLVDPSKCARTCRRAMCRTAGWALAECTSHPPTDRRTAERG